ncbi:hypothetical protein DRN69_00200 [Candidatus Pacearchaeota archaeon]|nr:MAG: hypothetical protein DRN69_00200 [Candidatus Pacearchaeota archaeon]
MWKELVFELLRENKIHVKDLERIILQLYEKYGEEYIKNPKNAIIKTKELDKVKNEIDINFHDFTINYTTITLPRDEHIYYRGERKEPPRRPW